MRPGTAADAFATPTPGTPRAAHVGLSAAGLLIVLAWVGHRIAFTQFQDYDDEGYLLITVRQFLQGSPLYDDVYTQYGPAYYLWQRALHQTIGIPLTHEATRLVTIGVWLGCSALAALPVWLLTKRWMLTAIAVVMAFFHLTQMTFEPGHPQELGLLGVMTAMALVIWRFAAHGHLGIPVALALGGLAAVTALTKVNVGAFLVGALALGLVTSLRRSRWRPAAVGVVSLAAFAAVAGVMRHDLLRPDIAAWVVVVWTGLLAALVAGSDEGTADGVVAVREVFAAAGAFALVSAAVVLAILAAGTSLRALFDGLFVWPLRLPAVFWRPLPVPVLAAVIAPVWLVAASARRARLAAVRRWGPTLALAVGQILCLLSIVKGFGLLLAFGPPLAWLVLSDGSDDPGPRAARRLLAFAAILMVLQAYPMPDGTQSVLGTVLFVPLALVVIADAERALRPRQVAPPRRTPGQRVGFALLLLVVATVVGVRVERAYARGIPLALPGAESVRAIERDAATYRWLTANVRAHCEGLLSAPGLNSLHFWSGTPPVSTLNATLWPILFDDGQQRRVLTAAASMERLCVVWDTRRMNVLMDVADTASRPLVAWLAREFEPRAAFGGWEFRARRGRDLALVYQGRWLDDRSLVLELPPFGPDPIARLAVVELEAERTLGDSASEPALVVIGEDGAPAPVSRGIDVSRRRRIVVTGALTPPSSGSPSVVVRLWAGDGRALGIVPVISEVRIPGS